MDLDFILQSVKKVSEPSEADINKKKNLTFNYKKAVAKKVASSEGDQAQSNPGQ